jgi:hypothetical protein
VVGIKTREATGSDTTQKAALVRQGDRNQEVAKKEEGRKKKREHAVIGT